MTNWPVSSGRSDGLELAVGHAALWYGPGNPQFEREQPHAYATREIIAAPTSDDLRIANSTSPWEAMRTTSLAILAEAALMPGCAAFEVRYKATPRGQGVAQVQMFLTAKSRNWHQIVAQAAIVAACDKLPPGFTWATPAERMKFGEPGPIDQVVLELRRDEELTAPQWDYIPASFYYQINDDPGDGSGWPVFWRALTTANEPVTVSLLFQNTELHWDERNVLGGVLTDLSALSQQRTEYDFLGRPMVYPACMNAKAAFESWDQRVVQLRRPLLARLAVRSEVSTAVGVANALASAVALRTGTTGTQPMFAQPPASAADERQANFSFDWLEIVPWGGHPIWADAEAPLSLRRMPYLFGLNEAATLMVLPVPDHQGVAGMARARRLASYRETSPSELEPMEASLNLGLALHEGHASSQVRIPLTAINRHVLVVGASGSGKTTTVLHLLLQLWRDHQIPFLVIESSLTEYRSLIGVPGLEELRVVTLGNESVAPLRLNPLAPPEGVRCEVHQSAVMASLKMALPLFPPQPQILAKALTRVYERAGWDDDTTIADGLAPPTLRDLLTAYRDVFARIGYAGEAKNIGLAFQTRLEGLLQGSRGKLLDTVHSTDFTELLASPTVIEMNDIQDADEKAILAAFILDRVRAGAKRRGSSGGLLKHVTVVEEAHRLLGKANVGSGDAASGDQARSDSVRAFCEAISELRSLGEGFVLSSQSPSALADAAVANCGSRIVHRIESAADRKVMLDDLDADDSMRGVSARLRKGEAVTRWPERDEIELVQVAPDDSIDSGLSVSTEFVAHHMADHRRQTAQLLPYPLCTSEVCSTGCLSRVRRSGEVVAEEVALEAQRLANEARASGGDQVSPVADLLSRETGADLQRAYCGAVHLSLLDAAFRATPGVDRRPVVVETLRRAVRDGQQ